MKSKIAACVILYNPEKEFLNNITSYINKVDKLYVFDNTQGSDNKEFFEDFENVEYFWENSNNGISICLNRACKKAIEDKYDYLLMMDQDSSFLEENIDQYFQDITNFKDKKNVAVYGLEYDVNNKILDATNISVENKDHLITSGSVLNLNLYCEIGGFDENLFIDGVDIDYCFAAKLKGYKSILFKNNYFKHSLGEFVYRACVFSLYLIKKNRNVHSPIRIYYIYRNTLYLEKKYSQTLPLLVKELKKNNNHHLKRSIKYSENLLKALKYRLKASRDFHNAKMGKI
jgi:rhamnosyltransferase